MNKAFIGAIIAVLLVASVVTAHADLDGFLNDLNTRAIKDITSFNHKLSTQFGIPLPQVRTVVKAVAGPADAFMCFQLSLLSSTPTERVVKIYQDNKKKGWGTIAKKLGIKPGSKEFHALKQGSFSLTGVQMKSSNKGHKKEKGQGKKK